MEKKRKRDDNAQSQGGRNDAHLPRITYHAVHKSFDRLFKEGSLEETKQLIRHKLKLASDTDVELEQWREGRLIDLEDDEDFAAFGALARTVPSLEVRVTVDGEGPSMAISTPASKKQQKKRSSSVPPPISMSQQHQSSNEPNAPLSKAELKARKRRMSVSGPTIDLPPPPLALPHAEPASLLALLKSKSKPKSTKRKLPADEEAHSFDPKVNAKAGPSTKSLSASGVTEPSTKKRKTNDGQAKGVVGKPVSRAGPQVEDQVKEKKGKKGKDKAKAKDIDVDMNMGSTIVDATEVSGKTKMKDKKEKMNKKISTSGSTGLGDNHKSGTSRAPPIDGNRIQDAEMGEEAPTMSKSKPKKTEKGEEKKEKGKAKQNRKIPEADGGAEHPADPSAKPKSTKEKAKKAAASIPPVITAEDGDDETSTISSRKLSAPTLTWLASLDKEMTLAKANAKGNSPVASTSVLPPPRPAISDQSLKKKTKPKKSSTSAEKPTELAAPPSPEEDPTVVGESSSTAVSKIKKAKSKPNASKGKDKELPEQEQDLELELEREQAQQIEAHMKIAENLAGVISKANSSFGLSLDGGETGGDVNGPGADGNGVKLKSKKASKKDLAGAGEEPAASSHVVDAAPKLKRRRKNTSAGEVSEISAIRLVNGEASKATEAKLKKRQSKHVETDMPVDDEVAEAPSNAKKRKVRPPRPVVSANTTEWDAKIRDATQTVLARNSPSALSSPLDVAFPFLEREQSMATSTSHQNETPSESEAEVEAEMSLPGKRQRSQSRLRMSWGPEDFQEDEAEPSTITEAARDEPAPAITRSLLPSSSLTTRKLPASSVPSVPTKLSSKRKRLEESDELPCPICLQTPFHLRYRCPVVEAGPDAIEKRLDELKKEDTGHRTLLIEELEHVIRNQKARASLSKSGSSSPGSLAKSAGNLSPMVPVSSSSGPSSQKLTVPSGSTISEVTVENKDEGSSNESSDDDEDSDDGNNDEYNVAEKQTNPYKLPPAFAGVASLADVDLEAIIRGPTSQSKSVLDDIPSRSISDDEDEAAEDVIEDEEDDDRLYRLRSKKFEKNTSSDENEGEDLAVPSDEGGREKSGDEEMADVTLKPSVQTQPLEDSSRTTQAGSQAPSLSLKEIITDLDSQGVDGSSGFVAIEPMDDDGEQTEVAPSAENEEETDESGLSIRKEKKALLAAVLEVVLPFSKAKDVSNNVVPQPESPIEETYPPEDAMDIIEPSQPSAEEMNEHADRSDPIEPADDLMDSVQQGDPEDASQSRAVSQSPRKPGLARRMKTRYGKVPFDQAVDLEADRPPISTSLRGAKAGMRSAEPSPSLGSGVLESARKLSNVEISGSEDIMPSPPVPAAKGPPRRGRPPLSQEVKAAREKARADNKAQKANEKARKTGAKQDEQVLQRVGKHDTKKIASPKGASQSRVEGSSTVQPSTPMSVPRNLDPPHSLDKWAAIHNSSSPRSVDQLRSSSPGHLLSADDDILSNGNDKQRTFLSSAPVNDQSSSGDAVTQHNPLFILSSSQVAFPYSQWQGESYANPTEDSPTESESEDEVPIKSKTKLQPHAPSSVVPKFRRLTDIASQVMFSQDILSSTPFPPTPVVTNKPQKQSDDSDEDEGDGDDTGSDSDTPVKSHIPKSRRAGATLRSKKGGLLSFT